MEPHLIESRHSHLDRFCYEGARLFLLYFRRTDRVTARHSEMQHKLSALFARLRYGGRGKAGRSRLVDEICVLCGYEREYASKLLRGRRPIAGESGKCRRGSQRIYAAAEREVIKAIWLSAEQPCGKKAHSCAATVISPRKIWKTRRLLYGPAEEREERTN